MSGEYEADAYIAKRQFERSESIDPGAFLISDSQSQSSSKEKSDEIIDDSVVSIAKKGERRMHFSLMVVMVLTWTGIGAIVGIQLEPIFATIGLISMVIYGFYLGERWIKLPDMRILGVTWVIISMKLLYGLMLDFHHWGWISASQLVGALLFSVCINVFIGQRHDEDAIAAQAALILLAVASGTGAIFGAMGVASLILVGTILLHGLAVKRKSGNLASLGIAFSNLWIGMHALSNNWEIFGLRILHFDDPLLLFFLVSFISAINAYMAYRFAMSNNWFSQFSAIIGLGKPGLWSVSVGLGMIGALMVITANRGDIGFSTSLVLVLFSAFGASYLVVRGVSWKRIEPFLLWPAPAVVILLILSSRGVLSLVDQQYSYDLFAIIWLLLTGIAFLREQSSVSDHVLWLGTIITSLIITILFPAEIPSGGDWLLGSQFVLWSGLGLLSNLRKSPSLVATTILGPWTWLLVFASDVESRIVSQDLFEIMFSQWGMSLFIFGLIVLQTALQLRVKASALELSIARSKSELSTQINNSGVLKIWNLSFVFPIITLSLIAHPDSLPYLGLVLVSTSLLLLHTTAWFFEKHHGNPRLVLITWSIFALLMQWRFGGTVVFVIPWCIAVWMLVTWSNKQIQAKSKPEQMHPPWRFLLLCFFILGVMAILSILTEKEEIYFHQGIGLTPNTDLFLSSISFLIFLTLFYLPNQKDLLNPAPVAFASIFSLVAFFLAAIHLEQMWLSGIFGVVFIASGTYLGMDSEIRRVFLQEKSSNQVHGEPEFEEKQDTLQIMNQDTVESVFQDQRRSQLLGKPTMKPSDENQPIILLVLLFVLLIFSAWYAYFYAEGVLSLILFVSISVIFLGTGKRHKDGVETKWANILGIESPVFLVLIGIGLIFSLSRLSDTQVYPEMQWGWATFLIFSILVGLMGLINNDDLNQRIPATIETILLIGATSKFLTVVMGIDRFVINLFAFEDLSWQGSFVLFEVFLLGLVFLDAHVEQKRYDKQLQDQRGAFGRTIILFMVAIISIGPALVLAVYFSIIQCLKWLQPAVIVGAGVSFVWSFYLLSATISLFSSVLPFFCFMIGLIGVLILIWSSYFNHGLWTTSGLWLAHLLVPLSFGLMSMAIDGLVVIGLLLVSCASWIAGIWSDRKSLRLIGAIDLVFSWVIAALTIIRGVESNMLLLMLIATALLLGSVTWMTQKHQAQMDV